jgi:hypothetical protein
VNISPEKFSKSQAAPWAAIQRRGSILAWTLILSVYGAETIAASWAAIQRRGFILAWTVVLSVHGADTIALDLSLSELIS